METLKKANEIKDWIIDIRRDFHMNPEPSFEEVRTSNVIVQKLEEMGVEAARIGKTGVLGTLKGSAPGKVVALRADIDALSVKEETGLPYSSKRPGFMHACGHDVHSTCLLGAAKILNELKDDWEGTVKLIFQPGEERNPGGASIMIKEGVLENPKPNAIFALHVHPNLEVGKLSFRPGMVMASADEIYMTITGKGGHAASPHLTTDIILVASHLVVSLQQLISRNNDPFNLSVLSITSFHGGNTTNVIPSEVKLMGTFRAMNEDWRYKAHGLIKKQAEELVHAMGGEIDVRIDVGYPFVLNNQQLTETSI
jgi:hippurate hydrolase